MSVWGIMEGSALKRLREIPDGSVQTCVTSPPYFGLRDYDHQDQIGMENTPDEFVDVLVGVFSEVRRCLRDDGTLWVVIGDSYNNRSVARSSSHQGGLGFDNESIARSWAEQTKLGLTRLSFTHGGLKEKDLIGIPWMLAFALRIDGWYLRSDIIWHKPNGMPESIKDRPTSAHEHVFLFCKSKRYFYDADSIRVPHSEVSLARVGRGRSKDHKYVDGGPGNQTLVADISKACHPNGANKRNVWTVSPNSYRGAHFAVFPPAIVEPCVLAGSREEDLVLDPFSGAATTGLVAVRLGRNFIGTELNPEYAELGRQRIRDDPECSARLTLEVADPKN